MTRPGLPGSAAVQPIWGMIVASAGEIVVAVNPLMSRDIAP